MTKANHKPGLHKDVATIFEKVWIPEIDNNSTTISVAYKERGSLANPTPLALDNWPDKAKKQKMTAKSWSSPLSFLSPKARREKKRINEISRNLLINMDD